MRIGAEDLLKQYGSRVNVAEALILGHISAFDEKFIDELLSPIFIAAAKIHLEARGALEQLKEK